MFQNRTIAALSAFGLILAFQNCSPVGFSSGASTVSKAGTTAITQPAPDVTPPTNDPAVLCACQQQKASALYVNATKIHIRSKSGKSKTVTGPGLVDAKDLARVVSSQKDEDDDDVDVEVGPGSQVKCSNGNIAPVSVNAASLSHKVNTQCHGGKERGNDVTTPSPTPAPSACPSYPSKKKQESDDDDDDDDHDGDREHDRDAGHGSGH